MAGPESIKQATDLSRENDDLTKMMFLYIFAGFVTPGPSNAALSCSIARQLCSEDPACAQILEILPKVCGVELGKSRFNGPSSASFSLIFGLFKQKTLIKQ